MQVDYGLLICLLLGFCWSSHRQALTAQESDDSVIRAAGAATVWSPTGSTPPIPAPSLPDEIATADGTVALESTWEMPEEKKPVITVYGFGQADYIQDFNRVDPNWEATLRPSRIPTTEGQFGADGTAIISARQSRLGVDGEIPLQSGTAKTKFEFDLFGVGPDEGQTTFRLRHAYGKYGNWLAGQTHSLFMDIDVFPNVIDYWGPSGMVFLRTPQIRWQPVQGNQTLAFAIENADEAIDVGQFDRVIQDLDVDVVAVERMPDLTSRYRLNHQRGYFQVASIFRRLGIETLNTPGNEPRQSFNGWGINLSTNYKLGARDRLIAAYVFGEGISSYMNDGGVDLAPRSAVAPADPGTTTVAGIGVLLRPLLERLLQLFLRVQSDGSRHLCRAKPQCFSAWQVCLGQPAVHPSGKHPLRYRISLGPSTDC